MRGIATGTSFAGTEWSRRGSPDMTVLSIDGIGAYDHVYRSSMMSPIRAEVRMGRP